MKQKQNRSPLQNENHLPRPHTQVVTERAIAKRAYEKFEARGYLHGFDQEDWIAAQKELLAEAGGPREENDEEATAPASEKTPFN